MRTLIDRMLGRKRDQSVSAVEQKTDAQLRRARLEFLRSAHSYSRAVSQTLLDLIETVDDQRAEIERLREERNGHT